MIRRALWFTAGAAAGVWATTRVQRTLRELAPESLAARSAAGAVAAGRRVREFALDVRAGMAERESELAEALGLADAPAPPPARRPLPGGAPAGTMHTTTGNHDRKEDH